MNISKKISFGCKSISSLMPPVLLALGLFLTFCGNLRIVDGVGLGELLLLCIALQGWTKGQKLVLLKSPFAWFWCLLLVLMFFGYLSNQLVANWVQRNTIAYVYTGTVSLGLILVLRDWSVRQLMIFLRALFIVSLSMLWFGFAFYFNAETEWSRILHLSDLNGARYTAWATNANQLALFFVPLPVWLLALKLNRSEMIRTIGWLILVIATMFMGLNVRSDALVLSWGLGLVLLIVLDIFWGNRREFHLLLLLALMAISVLLLSKIFISGDVRKTSVCSVEAILKLQSPVKSGCIAQGTLSGIEVMRTGYDTPQNKIAFRVGLWRNALSVIVDEPLIGHGPGAFSWYEDPDFQKEQEAAGKMREEAHNIPLDLMTQGGVLLGIAWLALIGWLMVIAWQARVPYVFVWVFMLGFFTLFMYHLRHPYLWASLILAQEVVRRGLWSLKPKTDTGASI